MSSVDTPTKRWTVLELLNWTTQYLDDKGFENSRLNVEIMLAHVLQCKRVGLYLDYDRPLLPKELQPFKALLKRRTAHEPLQYVIGETEFMGLLFKVGPGVLIPRPETELLVEKVLQYCKDISGPVNLLDAGTGSGCIALSLAHMNENIKVTAVDISMDALQYAKENAELLGLSEKVQFVSKDALAEWPDEYKGQFQIVVSNPPYVSQAEYTRLQPEIEKYEPEKALLAGQEGLDFYVHFLEISKQLLDDNGRLFFEIGETQAVKICKMYMDNGYKNSFVHQDLAGKDRVIELTL